MDEYITHNRKSIRLKEYDYSRGGYYFVTICTYKRMNLFGEIVDGEIKLNEAGEIVEKCIQDMQVHFPSVSIDYYCIMPNHLHIIIVLNEIASRRGGVTPPLPKLGNVIAYHKYQSTKQINILRDKRFQKVWQRNY